MNSISNCTFQNPWPGLFSYTENDSDYFHGREKEAKEIVQKISNEVLTTVFGESGCGKTSIVQAGVIPTLWQNDYFPVRVRVNIKDKRWNASLLSNEVAKQALQKGCHTDGEIHPLSPPDQESLWEYLHRLHIFDQKYMLLTPVMIVDQFEELFTIADLNLRQSWIDELVWAVNNFIPPHLQGLEKDPAWKKIIDKGQAKYRIVLLIREDYVGRLDELKKRLPSIMTNRFQLKKLTREQATVVIRPPSSTLFSESATKSLVDFLTANCVPDPYIDPSILSVTCRELTRIRILKNDAAIETAYITQYGQNILDEFYQKCISDVSPQTRDFVESFLLTTSGYRNLVSWDDVVGLQIPESEIDALIENRLLHVEERHGRRWLELSHDVLAPVVQESRVATRSKQAQKAARAMHRSVMIASGRMEEDNGCIIEDEEFDINGLSAEMLQHKVEKLLKSRKGETLSDLLIHFPTANCVELSFRDSFRKRTNSNDGIYILRMIYDKDKRMSEVSYYDSEGNPMLHKSGNHGFKFGYDTNGNEVKRTFINLDGTPKCLKHRYASKVISYDSDENPCCVTYLDESDIPCRHIDGNYGYFSTFDKLGNEVRRDFCDAEGRRSMLKLGYASVLKEYNPQGLLFLQRNFDTDNNPVIDTFFNHGIAYEYDIKGRVIKRTFIGIDKMPALCNEGYAMVQLEYNENDQPVYELFCNICGEPTPDVNGVYGAINVYDERERIKESIHIGLNREKILCKNGTGSAKFGYDEFGRTSCCTYFGINGNPTFSNLEGIKSHGVRMEFDEVGRINTITFISPFGDAIQKENGAAMVKIQHDDAGRMIKRSTFDKNGDPVAVDGSYGELYEFFEDDKSYQYCHDKNGLKLSAPIRELWYDHGGNISRYGFLDERKNRIFSEEAGFAYKTFEYDAYGNITKESFFNTDDQPIPVEDGIYGIHKKYDLRGRLAEEIFVGADTLPKVGKEGFAIKKLLYDDLGRNIRQFFYNADGQPVANSECNYGLAFEYDSEDREVSIAVLGADGAPHKGKTGFAVAKKEYDRKGNLIREAFYDEGGRAICSSEGFHAVETAIKSDKEWVINFYDDSHNLVDCGGRYATVKNTKSTHLMFQDRLVRCYFNSGGGKAENEEGHHQEILLSEEDRLYLARSAKGRLVVNNRTIWDLGTDLLVFLVGLIIVPPMWTYASLKFKYLTTAGVAVVTVGEVAHSGVAKSLGIKEGDVILRYHDWSYFCDDGAATSSVPDFEKELYAVGSRTKTVLFARTQHNKYTLFCMDFPPGATGISFNESRITKKEVTKITAAFRNSNFSCPAE